MTGITQETLDRDGQRIEDALQEFRSFIGDLPLVSYNAEFDMGFIQAVARRSACRVENQVACALTMARRAWPDRRSYRLADLARDGKLDVGNAHRALADCHRTMLVYAAAAARLRSWR
jgi:DNA polymerase III epsilon subunit-like protein